MSLRDKRIFIKALGITAICRFFPILRTCSSHVFGRHCLIKLFHRTLCSCDISADTRTCLDIAQTWFLPPACSYSACFCLEEQFWQKSCGQSDASQPIILPSSCLSASQFINCIFMSLWHTIPTFSASFVLCLMQPWLYLHLSVQECSRNSFFSDQNLLASDLNFLGVIYSH